MDHNQGTPREPAVGGRAGFCWGRMLSVAKKEMLDSIRSRWLIIFAVVFAILALIISGLGMSGLGLAGYEGFNRVTAGLLNLVLYLLPLISLVMGASSIAGEREGGSLHVLLTQPIHTSEIVIGKFVGLSLSLTTAVLTGFGGAGLIMALGSGLMNVKDYVVFVLLAVVLVLVFLSLAILISVLASKRSQALGLGIFVWFALILVYDFMAIGVASLSAAGAVVPLLLLLLLFNPADMVRVLVILQLGGEATFGPTLAALTRTVSHGAGQWLLLGALLVWIAAPLALACLFFGRKQDY